MYGTVAKLKLKPGMSERLVGLSRRYETLEVPGFRSVTVYKSDGDPDEFFLSVVFDSREDYVANAESPEQDERYREFREILAGDPDWHDGEIVYQGLR